MNSKLFSKFIVILFVIILLFVTQHHVLAQNTASLNIHSPAVILMEMQTGRIIYERNIHQRMYPASITKVMSAIVVLEHSTLDTVVTICDDVVTSIRPGYATARLQAGEELTVYELLNLHLIVSANDASNALAKHVAGSLEEFSNLMNEKSREIGMYNTNFTNPSGLHHENHYSTAFDLGLLGRYSMQNDTIRTIVRRAHYVLRPTNKTPESRGFYNTNLLIMTHREDSTNPYFFRDAIGIKTGFTTPAGRCLLASASRNNFEVIVVVLGAERSAEDSRHGSSPRYLDALTLFNHAFNNYSVRLLAREGTTIQTHNVRRSAMNSEALNMLLEDSVLLLMRNTDTVDRFLPTVIVNENLRAPVRTGDLVGTAVFEFNGEEHRFNLIAGNDIESSNLVFYLTRRKHFVFCYNHMAK